jgi:hypothetical protein
MKAELNNIENEDARDCAEIALENAKDWATKAQVNIVLALVFELEALIERLDNWE